MAALTIDMIFSVSAVALKKSFNDYFDMSGDAYRGAIPESYFQVKIADAFRTRKESFWITLENTYRQILQEAATSTKAINRFPSPTARADIVIWHANATPAYLVEVKRVWELASIQGDAEKIRAVLGYKNTLKGGLLIGTVYANRSATVNSRVRKIGESISARRTEVVIGRYTAHETHDRELYWGGGVYQID